ncbi:hypothetical protein OE88DRAFT_1804786 [Heliocybe sulcata]|uniref:Uncharacterized protein n=1 Tax=Heliocybe sulcata TaxID=5364 RepID=A0A5C3NF66_9AGAM|nr:hypothetical protein OE88DRAFT_1804786 [Heliocybe sulcata]
MTLPSTREIELETLLRKRDAQVLELTDEVTRLRQYLSTQPAPSTTDPVSLPPALVAVLTPHIVRAQAPVHAKLAGGSGSGGGNHHLGASASGNTALAALTQRAKLLQDENDELYELLRRSETGKLKEEVRGLRRVVNKLEGALRESHNVVVNLSMELEKSHETFAAAPNSYSRQGHANSRAAPVLNNGTKPPPTEPRAHKKPRLSMSDRQGARASLSPTVSSSAPHVTSHTSGVNAIPLKRRNAGSRDREGEEGVKREEGEEGRKRARGGEERGERGRDRPRGREREWDREKERERDLERKEARDGGRERERDRDRRRNAVGGTGAGRRVASRREKGGSPYGNGDRTLAQRLGL